MGILLCKADPLLKTELTLHVIRLSKTVGNLA